MSSSAPFAVSLRLIVTSSNQSIYKSSVHVSKPSSLIFSHLTFICSRKHELGVSFHTSLPHPKWYVQSYNFFPSSLKALNNFQWLFQFGNYLTALNSFGFLLSAPSHPPLCLFVSFRAAMLWELLMQNINVCFWSSHGCVAYHLCTMFHHLYGNLGAKKSCGL